MAGAALLAPVAVLGAASISLDDASLARFLEARLEGSLRGRLQIGAARWHWPNGIELADVSLQHPERGAVLAVQRLRGALVPAGLLGGELWLDEVRGEGVSAVADAELIAETLAPPPGRGDSPSSWRVQVRELQDVALWAGERSRLGDVELEALRLSGRIEAGRAVLEELHLRIDGGSAIVRGSLRLDGAMRHELRVELRDVPLARALGEAGAGWPLPESVSGVVELRGSDLRSRQTRAVLDLDLGSFGAGDLRQLLRRSRLQATLASTPRAIAVERAVLTSRFGRLSAGGVLPWSASGDVALSLRLRVTRPEGVVNDERLVARAMSASAELVGGWQRLLLKGSLSASGFALARWPMLRADVEAPFRFRDGRLLVEAARVEAAGGEGSVDGEIQFVGSAGERLADPRMRLEVAARALSPATLGLPWLDGEIDGEAQVTGTIGAPLVRASAVLANAFARGVHAESLTARAVLTRQRLEVDEISASLGGAPLRAALAIDWESEALLGSVTVAELPVARLRPLLPVAAEGRITAGATLSGTLEAPELATDGRVARLSVAGQELGALRARLGARHGEVSGRVELVGQLGLLDASGTIAPAARRLDLVVIGSAVSLQLAQAIGGVAPYIAGDGTLQAHVSGSWDAPELVAQLRAPSVCIEGQSLPGEALLTLLSTDEGYRLDGRIGELLDVTAGIALAPLRGSAEIAFRDVDLRRVAREALPEEIEAIVGGSANLRYGPAGVSASIRLDQLEARAGASAVSLLAPARLALHDGRLHVSKLELGGQGARMQVEGDIGDELELELRGRIEAGMVAPFLPAIAMGRGQITAALRLLGPRDRPRALGRVAVAEPLLLRFRGLKRDIELREGLLHLAEGTVGIERLAGVMQGGDFSARGRILVDAGMLPRAWDVELSGNALPIRLEELFLEVNAELRLAGEGRLPDVIGRVDVVRGRYLRVFRLEDFAFIAPEPTAPATLAERAPYLDEVRLDVHAVSAEPVTVRVNAGFVEADIEVESDVQISGSPLAPVLAGRIAATRGTLTFPATRLEVDGAAVDFLPVGPRQVESVVSLRATGEVQPAGVGAAPAVIVQLGLEGSLRQMAMTLDADPALERLQILSLLISGQTQPVAVAGRGASELDAALAVASSQLTGPLADFVERQIEEKVNFRIELGAQVTNEGFRITAAKQLTGRLRVESWYGQSLVEEASISGARLQLLLTDRFFVEGGTEGRTQPALVLLEDEQHTQLELKYRFIGGE